MRDAGAVAPASDVGDVRCALRGAVWRDGRAVRGDQAGLGAKAVQVPFGWMGPGTAEQVPHAVALPV